jgi:hypothetical protein
LKPIKFNPNDPKLWKDFDPTEQAEDFVDGKSQGDINRRSAIIKAYEVIDPQILTNRAKKIIKNREESGWYDKVNNKNKELSKDPKWIKSHTEASKKLQNSIEHKNRMKELYNSESWKQSQKENGEKKRKDPAFKKAVRAIKCKPIFTKDGIFDSRKSVSEFYKVDPTTVSNWLKNKPTEFYYISQEEYIMLTGKEI